MLAYQDLIAALPSVPTRTFSGALFRAVNYAALHGIHSNSP